jgi:uncharacterized protein (DUF1800 family)
MASLDPISGPLGKKRAAHLLRRATFGPTRPQVDTFATLTAEEAINQLFQPLPHPEPPVDPQTGLPWVNPKPGPENSEENDLIAYFVAWHIEQMRTEIPHAREKLTFFLHSHLPVSRSKVNSSTALYYQNKLYRHYAFGNFKELFKKVVIDNAMLVYIDNFLNTAENPNENFAREMFELYTIGKGPQIAPGDYTNFTEEDIKEAARVLTGYFYDESFENYDPELYPEVLIARGQVFATGPDELAILHDPGTKTFSEKFQDRQIAPNEIISGYATKSAVLQELDEMIDMIFDQPETARFICRKLYRFFVYYDITEEIEQDIIGPLAQSFRDNNYNLQAVLSQLFSSQHFYDEDNAQATDDITGAMIKSPVDLFVHIYRFFMIAMPEDPYKNYHESYRNIIFNYISIMGMALYLPPDVAGFPAYFQGPSYHRNWITPTNLAFRYWLIYPLLQGVSNANQELLFRLDILPWVENPQNISDPSNPETLVSELTSYLLATELEEERLNYFMNVLTDNFPSYYWTVEWNSYQGGGSDEVVKYLLSRLIISLVNSPEHQLF